MSQLTDISFPNVEVIKNNLQKVLLIEGVDINDPAACFTLPLEISITHHYESQIKTWLACQLFSRELYNYCKSLAPNKSGSQLEPLVNKIYQSTCSDFRGTHRCIVAYSWVSTSFEWRDATNNLREDISADLHYGLILKYPEAVLRTCRYLSEETLDLEHSKFSESDLATAKQIAVEKVKNSNYNSALLTDKELEAYIETTGLKL